MKKNILFIGLLIISQSLNAIIIPKTEQPVYDKLVATKDGRTKVYKRGEGVSVVYVDNGTTQKARGYITKINANDIEVSSFKKRSDKKTIVSIANITQVTKIERRKKGQFLIFSVVISLATGALFLATAGAPSVAPFANILAIIFGVAAFYSIAIAGSIIFIKQWLSKKSTKKGWKFTAE